MKASTKRSLVRWLHIGVGGMLAAYIYSPLGQISTFQLITKSVVIPLTILSGIWLWKGHLLNKYLTKKSALVSIVFLIALTFLASFDSILKQEQDELTLKINHVKKSGMIYISVCSEAKEWSENGKYHFKIEHPKMGSNSIKLSSIPKGNYAIAIYQDVNGNGKLDENIFGVPKEPFAFSNNIVPRFSSPTFKECQFDFNGNEQLVSIDML